MRRRKTNWDRPKREKKPLFDATDKINALEAATAYRTVTCDFTLDDVVRSLWNNDVVDLLKAAGPLIHHATTRAVNQIQLPGMRITIMLDTEAYEMPTPRGVVTFDRERGKAFTHACEQLAVIHNDFNKVRQSVNWLNAYASLSAARFYCPWVAGLMPSAHAIHYCTGSAHSEPTASIAPMANKMRECGAIVASAIFCGDVVNDAKALGVQVHIPTVIDEGVPGDDLKSQRFMLL